MEKSVGLFIGRFQPLHNGHMRAIEWILGRCGKLIVLVGSSQKCYELENPFTVGERIDMLYRTLKSKGVADRCLILSIPDIQNNALWVSHINSLVPRYDVVFTNNALTKRLFREAGREVVAIPFFDRKSNDGTKIRRAMAKGDGWEKLVPDEARKFMKEIRATERMREIGEDDKK